MVLQTRKVSRAFEKQAPGCIASFKLSPCPLNAEEILETALLLRKRIKCFPFTLRRRNLKTEVQFTLKTHQMFFVHTRKRIIYFPYTVRRRNLKTQQSQPAETLERTREHAHSKVLVEPTWLTALLFPPFWICV